MKYCRDWISNVLHSRPVLSCWDNEGQRSVNPCRMHTLSLQPCSEVEEKETKHEDVNMKSISAYVEGARVKRL